MSAFLEFRIWGAVPFPHGLTEDLLVQKVLYCVRRRAKRASDIAREVDAGERDIERILGELRGHDLVTQLEDGHNWEASIGVFAKDDLRVAQELARKYGEIEAGILRDAIPEIREGFDCCTVAQRHDWSELANVLVGGIVADLCVFDRVRWLPEYRSEELLPALHLDGSRWRYCGFEVDQGKIYPELRWMFYHNLSQERSGGLARWGYFGEDRRVPPGRPETIFDGDARRVMLALSHARLSLDDVVLRTGLPAKFIGEHLRVLQGFDPPGAHEEQGMYSLSVPVLHAEGLKAILSIGDAVAERIHCDVVLPYLDERRKASKERGMKDVLPEDVLAREFALQELIEEGSLPYPPEPPVSWNAGVWGWEGRMPLWDEME